MELLSLLTVEVRLLTELDGIPTLYYGILADIGWLPVERDLLEFNAVGFSLCWIYFIPYKKTFRA